MKPAKADIWLYLGLPGVGKTTLALAELGPRAIIFDARADPDLETGAIVVTDPRELIALVRHPGPMRLVWRGRDAPGGLLEFGCRVARAATDFHLLFDEIDVLTRQAGRFSENVYDVISGSRHYNLIISATARRPNKVPRDLVGLANRIVAWQCTDENDVIYLKFFIGKDAYRLPTLPDHTAIEWTNRGPAREWAVPAPK